MAGESGVSEVCWLHDLLGHWSVMAREGPSEVAEGANQLELIYQLAVDWFRFEAYTYPTELQQE